MKVVFIIPVSVGISPGQRFRFEHYLDKLSDHNIDFKLKPFLNSTEWKIFYSNKNISQKLYFLVKGVIKRLLLLFSLSKFDIVYIYREAMPFGPPVIEWFIAKILRKKIVFDFDDAIWINVSSSSNPNATYIKCTWKVKYICKWSYIVTVGNSYLNTFATKYCDKVITIPTVVDTENIHNKIKNQFEDSLTVGWTGTFTNFYNLNKVAISIKELQSKLNFDFIIIADKDPMLSNVDYNFIQWNKKTEIEDLLKFNIGIMPLYDTDIELGKCAFKAIQYMSLGIPAVVSPVGANTEVINHGVEGFYADSDQDWIDYLKILLIDKELRSKMGYLARESIIRSYSVKSTTEDFINVLENLFIKN